MTHEQHSPAESAELAALYAAGAMTPAQLEDFAEHTQRCESCREELRRVDSVVTTFFEAIEPVEPAPTIRAALLQRIQHDAETRARAAAERADRANPQVWRGFNSDTGAGMLVRRATEADWEEIGIPGITMRRLCVDRQRNQITMLVRMAAGTAYPRHVHDGPEECYVVSGDLHVGDDVLRAGDYQRCEPDSLHGVQWTEGGCELLLISSLTDEILD